MLTQGHAFLTYSFGWVNHLDMAMVLIFFFHGVSREILWVAENHTWLFHAFPGCSPCLILRAIHGEVWEHVRDLFSTKLLFGSISDVDC